MFEAEKWSEALKKAAEDFVLKNIAWIFAQKELTGLVEAALKEGFEAGKAEVLEDPGKYDLLTEDECSERRREPPERDEDG